MSNIAIEAPTECPSCSATLYRVNDQIFCPNTVDCPAQNTGKLINFCKKLKIKGFGEATLDKLGIVHINELEALEPADYMADSKFSEHMSNKLFNTVQSRLTAGIDFREFIAALSIPLVGDSASSKLECSDIKELNFESLKALGLGDKVSENLANWVTTEWPYLEPIWSQYITYKSQTRTKTNGLNVVITGKLTNFKNRAEASKYLESLGFTVKSSVTKQTDFLICEDGTTGSSYQKATKLNISITTIKSLEDNYVTN